MLFEKTFEMEEWPTWTPLAVMLSWAASSVRRAALGLVSLLKTFSRTLSWAGGALAVLDIIRMERGVVGAINVGRYRRKRLHERASGIVDPG
jgi:hypothetical protein